MTRVIATDRDDVAQLFADEFGLDLYDENREALKRLWELREALMRFYKWQKSDNPQVDIARAIFDTVGNEFVGLTECLKDTILLPKTEERNYALITGPEVDEDWVEIDF